jgi:flagellar biosynthetic protein FliR
MEFININPEQLQIFLLVLIRVSVVLFLFPVFASPMFPVRLKAALTLVISLLLFTSVSVNSDSLPSDAVSVLILMVSELIIGLLLGFSVRLFFGAAQLAGQLISFQMGFAIINVFDPQTGSQSSIIDQIAFWVIFLVFLMLNGHHVFITALVESFQMVPFGAVSLSGSLFQKLVRMITEMFVLGLKISSPALAALLFTSAAFGISAKFAPHMNILIAAFPLKIFIGLLFFGVSLQIIGYVTPTFIQGLPDLLSSLMGWLGGQSA